MELGLEGRQGGPDAGGEAPGACVEINRRVGRTVERRGPDMATPSSRYQDERAVHLISSRPRAVQRVLHRDGVRLAEQLLVERPQRVVDGPRGGARRRPQHARHGGRRDVRRDRDDAVAAELDELAAHGVLARVEQEVAAAGVPQRRDASVVARGLLDPPDVRVRCQSRDGLGQQVDARAPRHVVEDHGQVDGLGDREEVRLERALRRLDVVRRHDERAVRPQCFRPPAHGHDGARVDGARAGHDGHAAAARVDARLEHAVALGGVQRRGLARRAERHDAVRAARDVPLEESPQGAVVHGVGRVHGRHERDVAPAAERNGGGSDAGPEEEKATATHCKLL